MKKDLTRYSQIGIIVIAVILSVSALNTLYKVSYNRIYKPIRNELQARRDQETTKVAGLRYQCIAEAQSAYENNLRNSCEVRKTGGALSINLPMYKNQCLLDRVKVGSIDEFMLDKKDVKLGFGNDKDVRYLSTCKEYFFCDSDVISNLESTLESSLEFCAEKYPENK